MLVSPIEIQKSLKGMDYPADKSDLIKHAKARKASSKVINELEGIKDRKYVSATDLSKAFKGE